MKIKMSSKYPKKEGIYLFQRYVGDNLRLVSITKKNGKWHQTDHPNGFCDYIEFYSGLWSQRLDIVEGLEKRT